MANATLKLAPVQASPLFAQLRSLGLFKPCPDDFIHSLAALAKLQTVAPGTVIVAAGVRNDVLYVLVSGQVEVKVEGERVAVLSQAGDLIGEISALSSRLPIASVFAVGEVQYVEMGGSQLQSESEKPGSNFGYHLYRSLSESLSTKIADTNQKARQFEIINRTLENKVKDRTAELEARNGEIIASHRKMEELYKTKDITFKKLEELQVSILSPLQETMDKLQPYVQPSELVRVQSGRKQLRDAIAMLRPFSQLYSTEQAVRNKRVLLVESDRKQQTLSKMALAGSGVKLDIATTLDDGHARLNSGVKYDMAFVCSSLASLIPEIHAKAPNAQLIFMASCNVPAELPIIRAHSHLISNIVSRHPDDRSFTVKNVGTTVSKLVSKDLFGMERYLIMGAEVHSRPIVRSDARREMIEEMRADFANIGVRSTISERVAAVAEELLMNAIFDAPVDFNGKSLYNHLSRTTLVELPKEHQGEFRFACDGMLAAISVSDPFGGFQMHTLLDYLERNYSTGRETQDANKGGAGRGLHQIVVNSDLVVFNVNRGHKTEAIALFNLDPQMVVEAAKPSFHFFSES